ncbi:GNAT family N-acetyltransferase [Prauserella cavernicola]|uniref:GNAT family N-acetyltransferase n=1 Tax=Prauserella cavernicola TaxID=2800127 RepID=A0A934QUP0_9PSEU|nr:GNAT family N-acetyltransferase [Prauserella cavernicola]MBK1785944.1 GNAT family N-acetyltransferase [Prauserella cavernicola]
MSGFRLTSASLTGPVARGLIHELNAELAATYPEEGANHFRLDPEEVGPGRGAFLVASDVRTGVPLGCGAVRLLEPGLAEVKRMYVRQAARGRGVSKALLAELEARALALGVTRLVLETGTRQAQAIGLYLGSGFSDIERYGEYVGSELSRCMAKSIA